MKRLSLCLLAFASIAQAQTEVQLDTIRAKTPAGWKVEKPSTNFRQHQFSLPKAEGDKDDAELYVTDFGGGGLDANIARWKGMFSPPEGKTLDEATKVEKFKVAGWEVVSVDTHGTYRSKFPPNSPTAKEVVRPNFRRINVVLTGPEKQFFLILTGPQATVEKHVKDFNGFVRSFK